MTKLNIKVGHFRSLPWVPAYVHHESWPVHLVPCESSGVRQLAESGRVDFTPMAAADWFEMQDSWVRLKAYGISIRDHAESVALFSQKPLQDLDGADIAICGETQNSVRVLQALLKGKHGLRIGRWTRDVDEEDDQTPRLLIQDQAVAERKRRRFKHIIDIGEEWRSWKGLPLVSAVWVHHVDADPAAIETMENLIASSLQRYRADPVAAIEHHRRIVGTAEPTETIRLLHRNFDYELTAAGEMALDAMRAVLPRDVEGFNNASVSDVLHRNVMPHRLLMA